MVNIKKIHSNLLKIDKKLYKDIDIYYICYITIKKFGDCENIHSVNSFYLIIRSATGYFKEKNSKKYLIIDSIGKYKEVFSGIRSESIQRVNTKTCQRKKKTRLQSTKKRKRYQQLIQYKKRGFGKWMSFILDSIKMSEKTLKCSNIRVNEKNFINLRNQFI